MTHTPSDGPTSRSRRLLHLLAEAGYWVLVVLMWLLIPVWLILVVSFGPSFLCGVFIWWLIRMAINARYRKVTTMAYRTATETDCVRCIEGMPVVLVYDCDYKKRLCERHQKAYERIHKMEAHVLDGKQ